MWSRIGPRTPAAEALGGVAFAFAGWEYGLTLDGGFMALAFAFLLLITVIDLEHRLILNKVLLVALPLALLSSALWSDAVREPLWSVGPAGVGALLEALAGAGVGFVVLLLIALVARGGMGGGDVKFAVVIGAWTGLRLVGVALMLSVVLGGIVAILLLIARRNGRKDAIPFAPFLCTGTALTLVYGSTIWNWYIDLLA